MANMYAMQKKKIQNNLEEELQDKDLFGPVFAEYAQSLVDMLVTKGYKVAVSFNPADQSVGYTDGRTIYVNAGCNMLRFYAKQEMRFNATLGVLFHECGHCNDPTLLRAFQSTLEQIDTHIPFIAERDDFDSDQQEVYDLLTNPQATPIILEICKDVMNIGLDAHDEAMMTANFNEMVGYCLAVTLGIQEGETPRLDQLRKKKKLTDFDITMTLLFQFIRFGKFIMTDTDESWDDPAVTKIMEMSSELEIMRTSDDPTERANATFDILAHLWPMVKDQMNQQNDPGKTSGNKGKSGQSGQQGQGGNGGSQNSQGTPGAQSGQNSQNGQNGQSGQNQQGGQSGGFNQAVVSGIVSAIQKAAGSLSSKTPANTPNGKTTLSAKPSAPNGGQAASGTPNGSQAANGANNQTGGMKDAANALAQIKKEVASAKADQQLENDQVKATDDALAIVQTENACTTHKGRTIRVISPVLSTDKKAKYDRIYHEVAPFVQRLVNSLKELFEELRAGSVNRGRFYGRVDTKSLRRIGTDQKIFCNKKNPIDIPDLAICLLFDQSGSMSGRRIHACEKAGIMIEAVADKLDIPIMVCGHNTTYGGIRFYVHRDYDTVDPRRKYSIAEIETAGSNRDGFAIYAATELLGKRPESDKLLLIISDGQPADDGYGGESAAEDIRRIVNAANRKYGIETIAAAIGDDKDRIKSIYRSGYLDVSDLSKLPKALTKVIRDRLEQ